MRLESCSTFTGIVGIKWSSIIHTSLWCKIIHLLLLQCLVPMICIAYECVLHYFTGHGKFFILLHMTVIYICIISFTSLAILQYCLVDFFVYEIVLLVECKIYISTSNAYDRIQFSGLLLTFQNKDQFLRCKFFWSSRVNEGKF